jgi:DNA polymerase III epsilon subunit-like protein
MKVVIAGSRSIKDYELLVEAVHESGFEISTVLSGHADGVDKLGEQYAEEHNLPLELYPADWKDLSHPDAFIVNSKWGQPYDAKAGHRRNETMAEIGEALILLWDGKSKGSKDMLERAIAHGLKTFVKTVNLTKHAEKKKIQLQEQTIEWAKTLRSNPRAVVLDTESCGGSTNDEIIALAIVNLQNGKPLFNSLLRPMEDVKFNWYATQVHGIYKKHLINAPQLPDVYDEIYNLLNENEVLAYNHSADKRMINQTIKKYDLEMPDIYWHCIMKAFKKFTLRSENTNLTQACAEMKVKAGTHDALEDALAACRIVYRIANSKI